MGTDVDAHGSDVCTSFAGNPEDGEVLFLIKLEKFAFINGSDSQLSLDGSNSSWLGGLEGRLRRGLLED